MRNLNGELLGATLAGQFGGGTSGLGSNSWRIANFVLENGVQRVEKDVEETKKSVEEVNRLRKRRQEKGGEDLNRLEKRWTELVSGNIQVRASFRSSSSSSSSSLGKLSLCDN